MFTILWGELINSYLILSQLLREIKTGRVEKKRPRCVTGSNAISLGIRGPIKEIEDGIMEIHISNDERYGLEDEVMEEIPEEIPRPRMKSVVGRVISGLSKSQVKPEVRETPKSQSPLLEGQTTRGLAKLIEVLQTPHPSGDVSRSVEMTFIVMLDLESRVNLMIACGFVKPDQLATERMQGMVREHRRRLLWTYVEAVKDMRAILIDLDMQMVPCGEVGFRGVIMSECKHRQRVYEQFKWLQDLSSRCGTIAGQYGNGKKAPNGLPLWGDLKGLWKDEGNSSFSMKETITSIGKKHYDIHLFSVTDSLSKEVMKLALCPVGIGELVCTDGVVQQVLMGRLVLQRKEDFNQWKDKDHVDSLCPGSTVESSWNLAYVRLPPNTYNEGRVSKSFPFLGTLKFSNLQKNGMNKEPYKTIYWEKRSHRPSRDDEDAFFYQAVYG